MAISLHDLKKAESTPSPQLAGPDEPIELLVKVNEPGYVPAGVRLRARISDLIFTAATKGQFLLQLEKDAKVVSIAKNRPLRSIQ